jgi:hypothetical protein
VLPGCPSYRISSAQGHDVSRDLGADNTGDRVLVDNGHVVNRSEKSDRHHVR